MVRSPPCRNRTVTQYYPGPIETSGPLLFDTADSFRHNSHGAGNRRERSSCARHRRALTRRIAALGCKTKRDEDHADQRRRLSAAPDERADGLRGDRKRVVSGQRVSGRVTLGGRRVIKTKKTKENE